MVDGARAVHVLDLVVAEGHHLLMTTTQRSRYGDHLLRAVVHRTGPRRDRQWIRKESPEVEEESRWLAGSGSLRLARTRR